MREGSRVHTCHGLFISRCSGFPAILHSLAFYRAHTELLSHKSLSSANEKYIAESDIITGHDSSHPATYRRLLAAIRGSFASRGVEGTRGCSSGHYLWEDELISKSNERIQGKISQLLTAVQHLELTYSIKLSPASAGQA